MESKNADGFVWDEDAIINLQYIMASCQDAELLQDFDRLRQLAMEFSAYERDHEIKWNEDGNGDWETAISKFIKKKTHPDKRSIWMRVGVTISGQPSEIDALLSGNANLKEVLEQCDWEFNGDSYCPEDIVEDYNAEYGTNFDTRLCEYVI